MNDISHRHVFLGEGHAKSEKRTWRVIWLCTAMMVVEIIGGFWFGSIALVADGLHMSTHAGALLLAALAYTFARKHADDPRFSFGTGKLGDLAGFTSAIILAMISLLIGYEAVSRLFQPEQIHFAEAIPIAFLGLCVNIGSAWLLSGGEGHSHGGHSHGGHGHEHAHEEPEDDEKPIVIAAGILRLDVFEETGQPRFRLYADTAPLPEAADSVIETIRPDGTRQSFALENRGYYLESGDDIPEPHEFTAIVRIGAEQCPVRFEEHGHEHGHAATGAGRDNNMRAAVVHVIADAAVSVLVIIGLILAKTFGWLWMDPLAGIIGALVIASWALGLIRDTGSILLDMNPDRAMAEKLRSTIENDGDTLADLHLWRLGPGHLGAILCIGTDKNRAPDYYKTKLARFHALSHLTVEVHRG